MTTAPSVFRSSLSETVFKRYAHDGCETWERLADVVVDCVCGGLLRDDEIAELKQFIREMKFIPGGRYLYYAGKPAKFWNNCYIFKSEEDSREDWSSLSQKATQCLMTGGGIGNDYSVYREKGRLLSRTGGVASGPLPAMYMVNEIGRQVMQGGGRRSAIYASLAREHADIFDFLSMKDWDSMPLPGTDKSIGDAKKADFMFPAPMDHTNISVNYGDEWLALGEEARAKDKVFFQNCLQALSTAEPGFSFNFGEKASETGRNACTEVTSADDCDVCNLGSANMSRIDSLEEFERVVRAGIKFLMCGSIRSEVPLDKIQRTREKNRRLGLGIMGVHEWLLLRGFQYEVTPELHRWLAVYRDESNRVSREIAHRLNVSCPVANRAIAPTGTIGIVAGTTTGIEPMFAPAYLRRYMQGLTVMEEYVVDPVARAIAQRAGIDPDDVENALTLAADPERRIKFQADVQDYVDMSISSTINLPAWGSDLNNPDTVPEFARLLAKYAPRLRGFTCYPDGARGGQPLTRVPFAEALRREGKEEASDICTISGKGGTCGA